MCRPFWPGLLFMKKFELSFRNFIGVTQEYPTSDDITKTKSVPSVWPVRRRTRRVSRRRCAPQIIKEGPIS